MIQSHQKLTFQTKEVESTQPSEQDLFDVQTYQHQVKLQTFCFQLLENREISLSKRLEQVGTTLEYPQRLEEYILNPALLLTDDRRASTKYSISMMKRITSWFLKNYHSIEEYERALPNQLEIQQPVEQFLRSKQQLLEFFPDHEIYLEKILINHLFYRNFPIQNQNLTLSEQALALGGLVMFLQFLLQSLLTNQPTLDQYVDIIARLFRVIAHTNFEAKMVRLLKEEQIDTFRDLSCYLP